MFKAYKLLTKHLRVPQVLSLRAALTRTMPRVHLLLCLEERLHRFVAGNLVGIISGDSKGHIYIYLKIGV